MTAPDLALETGEAGDAPATRFTSRAAFTPDTVDLILATVIALGLPLAAGWLLDRTGGALASLVLYYGVCCIAVVRWRRGRLDYHWPAVWPWAIFLPALLLPLASAVINAGSLTSEGASLPAVITTLLIWGGLNGAAEQLAWFYVLDAWRFRWPAGAGPARWLGLGAGVLLTLILVALIHILFWARFLPVGEATPLSRLSIPLNLLLTGAYYWLYRRSGSMWPVVVVHFLVDAQLVWLAQYSIWPDL